MDAPHEAEATYMHRAHVGAAGWALPCATRARTIAMRCARRRGVAVGTAAGGASEPAWFKSSYSSGPDGESCVEIAMAPRTVHVRDSKNTEGPRLTLSPGAWSAFLPYAGK